MARARHEAVAGAGLDRQHEPGPPALCGFRSSAS